MRRFAALLSTLLSLAAGSARGQAPVALQLAYDTYAAGLDVAKVEAGIGIGTGSYQVDIAYRTTGLAGFFYRGHQFNSVAGTWHDHLPLPRRFHGTGIWRGEERITDIDYDNGLPLVRQLMPPNESEREPVPSDLQAHSIDTLSALAELIWTVAQTGRCETTVRTYDGRRATEISAHTSGEELLPPTHRSAFQGPALRCDFAGRMLAGFKFEDHRPTDRKPLHGSAWLAAVVPDGPRVPVRMAFETRWFGDATMYLTSVSRTDTMVARH